MELIADRDVCMASGNCVRTAPTLFDQDEDGRVLVIRTHTRDIDEEQALEDAVLRCPAAALDSRPA